MTRGSFYIGGNGSLRFDNPQDAEAEATRGMQTGEYAQPQTITYAHEYYDPQLHFWRTTDKNRYSLYLPDTADE